MQNKIWYNDAHLKIWPPSQIYSDDKCMHTFCSLPNSPSSARTSSKVTLSPFSPLSLSLSPSTSPSTNLPLLGLPVILLLCPFPPPCLCFTLPRKTFAQLVLRLSPLLRRRWKASTRAADISKGFRNKKHFKRFSETKNIKSIDVYLGCLLLPKSNPAMSVEISSLLQ